MKILYVTALIIVSLGYFLLVWQTRPCFDDYGFAKDYYANDADADYGLRMEQKTEYEVPAQITLKSFLSAPNVVSRVLKFTISHYRFETGRYTSALMMRISCGMPRWLFAAISTFFWVMLLISIQRLGFTGLPNKMFDTIAILLGSFFLLKPQAVLWTCGAPNYLWAVSSILMFVPAFLSKRMNESPFVARNWWMWFLPVVALVLAGGHELSAMAISALLVLYLAYSLCKDGVRISGRLLFAAFFWIGALLVVLSPASLHRSQSNGIFAHNGEIVFFLCKKGMSLVRCVCENPVVLLGIIISLVVCFSERVRSNVSSRMHYMLVAFVLLMSATCVLTNGVGDRVSWDAAVVATLMVMVVCEKLLMRSSRTLKCGLMVCLAFLNIMIYAASIWDAKQSNASFNREFERWMASRYDQMNADDTSIGFLRLASRRLCPSLELGCGSYWSNFVFAKYYQKQACLYLPRGTWDLLNGNISKFMRYPVLPNVPGWHLLKDAGLLVRSAPWRTSDDRGRALIASTNYKPVPKLSPIAKIWKRILRKGWAEFSLASPEEEMAKNMPLHGFIFENFSGMYEALFFNARIPSDALLSLSVKDFAYFGEK